MDGIQWNLQRFDAVGSTNEVVKRALEAGVDEGYAATARIQEGGYGRQGRRWASPEGGMYLSLLLRPSAPPERLSTLSLAVAVAVRRACASLVASDQGRRLAVKWPNDVVVLEEGALAAGTDSDRSFAKICGISLEAHGGGICVGIGVNVEPPAAPCESVEGKNAPVYMADLGYGFTCDRRASVEGVCQAVLQEFAAVYGLWRAEGFGALAEEFNRFHGLAGRSIAVVDRNEAPLAEGMVQSVDGQGRLLIRAADGSLVPIVSGEAHILH